MTSAVLATAPELFAGGAVIAGLPYGAASGMMEAFGAMGQVRRRPGAAWGELVRAASDYAGPRPAVQIWHGLADETVAPGNADELELQWRDVLGLAAVADADEVVDGARHRVWRRDGRAVLERWDVPGLGHGTRDFGGGGRCGPDGGGCGAVYAFGGGFVDMAFGAGLGLVDAGGAASGVGRRGGVAEAGGGGEAVDGGAGGD